MFGFEEEKLSTVLGEALLSLFEDDSDISAEALSAQLNQMLATEADSDQRQLIFNAIRQTECYFTGVNSAGSPGNGSDEDEHALIHVPASPDNRH